MIKFYGYPKCSTCRTALKHYESLGQIQYHNLKEEPINLDELTDLFRKSNLPIEKWFNTSGQVYKQLNLKEKLPTMTLEEKLELLSSNGMLIKRPVIVMDSQVLVGFKK